jgi:hypothetical protein
LSFHPDQPIVAALGGLVMMFGKSRLSRGVSLLCVTAVMAWPIAAEAAGQLRVAPGSSASALYVPPPASQPAPPPTATPARAPAPVVITASGALLIPEGTEVRVRLNERLSSASNIEGDEFSITTDEPIQLSDGTIIPAGFRGRGEVTDAHKKGMLGKAGELHIRLDYFKIGDTRVHLRAEKGGEGKSGVATTVVLTLLITPLFLMHHGAELVYPQGQKITAFVDQDTKVPLPMPPAPQVD